MLLCHPQRFPRIRFLTQLLLAFNHITTNPPTFITRDGWQRFVLQLFLLATQILTARIQTGSGISTTTCKVLDRMRTFLGPSPRPVRAARRCTMLLRSVSSLLPSRFYLVSILTLCFTVKGEPVARGQGNTRSAAKSMAAQAYLTSIGR